MKTEENRNPNNTSRAYIVQLLPVCERYSRRGLPLAVCADGRSRRNIYNQWMGIARYVATAGRGISRMVQRLVCTMHTH